MANRIIVERKLLLDGIEDLKIKTALSSALSFQKWGTLFADNEGNAYEDLTRDFYSGIISKGDYFTTTVRGKLITVNTQLISQVIECEKCDLVLKNQKPSNPEICRSFVGAGAVNFKGKEKNGQFPIPENTEIHIKLLGKMVASNLYGTTCCSSKWARGLVDIVYFIISGKQVDVCRTIFDRIKTIKNENRGLFFPCLITKICKAHGIKSRINLPIKSPQGIGQTTINHIKGVKTSDQTDTSIKGGSANFATKRKNVERTEESREPVVELECLEHYKSKCFYLSAELEKKKEECIVLQGKLAEVETRKATATDETEPTPADATYCRKKMFPNSENGNSIMECVESCISKLESLNQRLENENITMVGCVESCISNLKSLIPRSGKERSKLRCAPLCNTEKMISEGRGLQNDVTQSSESLRMEDSDNSVDPKDSLGDLMDTLAMKYRNLNKDQEIKWKSEAEILSSFEVDPELCMKAVCALYRHKMSEDEISVIGFLHCRDVVRVTTLAEFLMDGNFKGDLKKSVEELDIFDSEAVEDCKMLAVSYSEQLFSIYENRKDSYFLPTTTDSHGDLTAK